MASNVEATKKAFELFQRGDVPTLVKDLIDDNCTWISPGPQDKLPWAGSFKGKQGVASFFARVGENLEFEDVAPREMIEERDTVVVLGTTTNLAKKTGKTIKYDWAIVLKYSHGKIVFVQEYMNTAAYLLAMS